MPDLLVRLYDLPEPAPLPEEFTAAGTRIRPAMAYEKRQVVEWVGARFGDGWASECDVCFANHPISCLLATQGGEVLGFACYDATCRGFFGPVGVAQAARGHGVGRALLLATLHAMSAAGYAYAIIGGAGSAEFYEKAAGAIEIPGSTPGIYRDRLRVPKP
jgi:GNAT superfamily N-acetyltransferase